MFRSLNIAATGMAAQETALDTTANNIANANTTGFKRQEAEFEDLLYQNVRPGGAPGAGAPTSVEVGSGARIVATSRQFAQGAVAQTGNPLDIAIEGSGFLAVTRTTGETAYTRAGSLKLDATGHLVTTDGLVVEPGITIPADATGVTIGSDGMITATEPGQHNATTLGQLTLATFPNPAGLASAGHNLFTPTGASGEPTVGNPGVDGRGTLMQNALEGSNVEVVTEMIAMIRTQRAYEINSKVISAANDMLQNATQLR